MTLGSCEHTAGRAAQSCGHEGDVGIECHVPDMSECIGKSVTYQVRTNYYIYIRGKLKLCYINYKYYIIII